MGAQKFSESTSQINGGENNKEKFKKKNSKKIRIKVPWDRNEGIRKKQENGQIYDPNISQRVRPWKEGQNGKSQVGADSFLEFLLFFC